MGLHVGEYMAWDCMWGSTWHGIACGGVYGMGLHVGEYMAWDCMWGSTWHGMCGKYMA